MKRTILIAFLGIATFAQAQLNKGDFILGVDIGLSNQGTSTFEEPTNWSARGRMPIGINAEYVLTDDISLGYRGRFSMLFINYNNGVESHNTDGAIITNNFYGIYHYIIHGRFIMGSGLSLGLLDGKIKMDEYALGKTRVKMSVVFADMKYIFDNNIGLQGNIYLFKGYNTMVNIGAFYKF